MSNIAISLENISKQYRLGEVSTGTLSHDLNRWFAKIRGKEDPYLKVGDTNDRTQKAQSNYVWSLKDVSFDVKQGEVLGIIGRNGAGKSTLLKILSKVTQPTTGKIKVKGRIASLLEVGTGFHPELTGRENIFLNGAILGMTKAEIKRKFDEIVDFSGVERYIDTPVKRYSSGMYVRLAFAVAAHLEPEILIVDEVLAVGDAEFQKKCLGKMKDVSGEGRTVLFVSHNLPSLKAICNRGVLLNKGLVTSVGTINDVVDNYLTIQDRDIEIKDSFKFFQTGVNLINFEVNNSNTANILIIERLLKISVEFELTFDTDFEIEFHFTKDDFWVMSYANFAKKGPVFHSKGVYKRDFEIVLPELLSGSYIMSVFITKPGDSWFAVSENAIFLNVINNDVEPYLLRSDIYWGKILLEGKYVDLKL